MKRIKGVTHFSIFIAVFAVTFAAGALMALLTSFFSTNKESSFRKAAKVWAKLILLTARLKISVSGTENIPKNETVIFASNHQGNFDIPILLSILPANCKFMIKKELFGVPVFGWYLRKAGHLMVDREAGLAAARTLLKTAKELNSGVSVLIFPEGTRSPDGTLGDFKRGIIDVAGASKKKVVPIGISGSHKVQAKGKLIFYPQPISVKIGKPIELDLEEKSKGNYQKALMRVREEVSKLL